MVYLFASYFFRKMSKSCTNPECKQKNPQPLSAFHKHKKNLDGLTYHCKECNKARQRKHLQDPVYYNRRKKRRKTEEAKKKRRIYVNARGTTPWGKLKHKYANRLRCFVIRGQDSPANHELFGCTYAEIRAHIEDQFKDGMSWENYHDKVWEFDHIVPYHAFPTVEELQKHHKIVCWYKNVRPLPPPENRGVGRDDYDEDAKQALIRRFQLWEIKREVLALI